MYRAYISNNEQSFPSLFPDFIQLIHLLQNNYSSDFIDFPIFIELKNSDNEQTIFSLIDKTSFEALWGNKE